MWTLPLLAALVIAQPAESQLSLTNIRSTHGELGDTRTATAHLPGDVLFVAFDIEGLTVSADSQSKYTMKLEVYDAKGGLSFKNEPVQRIDFVPLGGKTLPGRVYTRIGVDQPAGDYNLRLTVTDDATKANKSFDRKFSVLPKDFGIVSVYCSIDEGGQIPAPTTGIVGQAYFIQFGMVSFSRDPKKKQPNLLVEMTILDEQGRPTTKNPISSTIEGGLDEQAPGLNLRFLLPLTRSGKFTVKLKATDKVTNKTANFELPVTIINPLSLAK
jgi:hypothetical protein